MKHFTHAALALTTLTALSFCAIRPANAQTYTLRTLAAFNGANGAYAHSTLAFSHDGATLYGTTIGDGENTIGTVFSLGTSTGAFTNIATFHSDSGASPSGSLALSADGSTLYGTTGAGGDLSLNQDSGGGTIYSVPTAGGAPAALVTFNGTNGAVPYAGLTPSADSSILYGTTSGRGASNGGTVFSFNPSTGALATLYTFDPSNAGDPLGGVTLSADGSALYGTTVFGGPTNSGTVFSLDLSTGACTTLAAFNGANGTIPIADLALSVDGKTLYGVTREGGADNQGTIFSVPTTGGTPTALANFNGANGSDPIGGLTLSADGTTLFGTTSNGGANNKGVVFSLDISTGALTTLATFDGANGSGPSAKMTFVGSTLYGTTIGGGPTGSSGTVFALTPAPEPSPLAALSLGVLSLCALGLRARKRSSRRKA